MMPVALNTVCCAAFTGLCALAAPPLAAQVTKHISDFATPGGGGYPNDAINDHQAFRDAAAFFQARHGRGTLILGDGEYIIGAQQVRNGNDPSETDGWSTLRYPLSAPGYPFCYSLVANQQGFVLDSCSNFTLQGGANTSVRYRDCLYYGTFLRDALSGEVSSAVGAQDTLLGQVAVSRCVTCTDTLIMPQWLNIDLRHAAVGIMFSFYHCDSITVRNVELNGNIDAAILGGKAIWDGMQTDYDGIMLWESSRCLIDNVNAHHFGRDGILISSGYNGPALAFVDSFPILEVTLDTDSSETLIFNNTIKDSRFEWNGRQGISWTGCSGLHAINCDFNYNGAGRISSSPGTGLDIEGGGGPMRVRYGVFDDCRFLHNRGAGVHANSGPCWGQQDFRFNNCVVKAGEDADALWANSRGLKFIDCQIYGRVASLFEQAENIPYDPDYNLLFHRTDFREEDDDWSYVFVDSTQWSTQCTGNTTHKLDLVAPDSQTARVTFDSCGFYTNCYGKIRMVGRRIDDHLFPRCRTCIHCGTAADSLCAPGTCATLGPIPDTTGLPLDARFIRAINCRFKNTGRRRCVNPPSNFYTTELISVDLTRVVNFQLHVPDAVRGGGDDDIYGTAFGGASWNPPGLPPNYYSDVYVTDTTYESFPPCKTVYHWPDSIVRWEYCNPAAGNLPTTPCGNYILTKTASPTETQPDSTVTFTITVCNNTVYATPVLLSEQLPPSFVVTSADSLWSGTDTMLTLNNGQCAVLRITGYFTTFGEFTNTVTLDTDTAATGGELSATAQVSVASQCAANTVIPHGTYASSGFTFLTGTVNIQGDFLVDANVVFFDAQVFMEAGAQIVLQNGADVTSITSSFTACNGILWKGIDANSGSMVFLYASKVADAENAVQAIDGAIVLIEGCDFHNNRVDVSVPPSLLYSNVSLFAQNTAFHSEGPLALPYTGQTTAVGSQGYAAFDVHNMFLDLTGHGNKIHHKSNGVVASKSDVTVLNCSFRDIQPIATYDALVGNGAGINCHGLGGWHLLKQYGFGADATAPPSFEDCHWGIYTQYMSVYSTENFMENVGTAYRVEKSGFMDVDILGNRVECQFHGIDLRFNDGASHVLVEDNDITFGGVQCDFCKGYTGILVTEGNNPANDSRIMNNTIRYLPVASSRIGIGLTATADWLVADNTLLMASNAHNLTGIYLNGCNRPEVSCNTIAGASAVSFPLESQSAIRNVMGTDPLIGCNVVDLTTNGILFNGVAPNTDLRGNKLNRHRWGLHLDATAIIDVQDRKGNLWYQPPPSDGLGAWYEVSNSQAAQSIFLYNPALLSGGSTLPPSWSPPDWFSITFGTNYDCDNHHGVEYCSQFKQRGKEQLTELDVKVASDSLENNPYTEETKWMLKSRLYKKLDENPDLVDSLQLAADLYADVQGSAAASLKAIDDSLSALFSLDSNLVLQLRANLTEIDSLMYLVKEALVQLSDSTLSAAQQELLVDVLNDHREGIRAISDWNTGTLQTAAASKVVTANAVQSLNTGIATSELIEANEKTVNELYLATVGKNIDEFTPMQAEVLLGIASQCPMLGGNAVFKARSLYWLIDDGHDFDDASLCLPHGIVVKNRMDQRANAVSLVPNPAMDAVALVLANNLVEPGVFILCDAVGSEVLRRIVPIDMPRFAFSTALLAPGLYHYQVRGPSGIIGDGKLTIIR